MPKVGARSITKREDRKLTEELAQSTKKKEVLTIEPNAWMRYLEIDESEVSRKNADILLAVRAAEKEARSAREKKGKKPLGAALLREATIMRPHTPKKKERKIFVLCLDKEFRILFIQKVKALHDYCKKLYKQRLFHLWPPGMFLPPAGMRASAIELA